MTNQTNEAAERSAHVTRGEKPPPAEWPVVRMPDGTWKLKSVVALEARIAELEAVQQHIYHIVSTGILHQSSLSKDGLIELLKDAQEVSYNAGWNSTTLTGGENE